MVLSWNLGLNHQSSRQSSHWSLCKWKIKLKLENDLNFRVIICSLVESYLKWNPFALFIAKEEIQLKNPTKHRDKIVFHTNSAKTVTGSPFWQSNSGDMKCQNDGLRFGC